MPLEAASLCCETVCVATRCYVEVFPIMFLLFRCLTYRFFNPLCKVFGSVSTEAYPLEAEKTTLNKCNVESTAGC